MDGFGDRHEAGDGRGVGAGKGLGTSLELVMGLWIGPGWSC